MGTRGLTAVVKDGEFKVAQYGQWDHYLSGAGYEILEFLKTPGNVDLLRNAVDSLVHLTSEDLERAYASVGAGETMFLTLEQHDRFLKIYPGVDRNLGPQILNAIIQSEVTEIKLDVDFANDSLFCEYAYVIDLDTDTFEIYKGFQEYRGRGRFVDAVTSENDGGYWPVSLIASYPLDSLPDDFGGLDED